MGRQAAFAFALALVVAAACFVSTAAATANGAASAPTKDYREKNADRAYEPVVLGLGGDVSNNAARHDHGGSGGACHENVDHLWFRELSGSTFVSPVVLDLLADGLPDVLFAESRHRVDAYELASGARSGGAWPFVWPDAQFYAAPLAVDVSGDGVEELLLFDSRGRAVALDQRGVPLRLDAVSDEVPLFWSVPPLCIAARWMDGLESTAGAVGVAPGAGAAELGGDVALSFALAAATGPCNESTPARLAVDAHVLASPVRVRDNGRQLVLISVSYYFDRAEKTFDQAAPAEWSLEPENYLACALVALDVDTRTIAFVAHFDLTTMDARYRAFAHASPTVAYLYGDGVPYALVGTSAGMLYVVNVRTGVVAPGFPRMMDSIQAEVRAAPLGPGGAIAIVAVDMNSNVVAFTPGGREFWEAVVRGAPTAPVFADVDQDGVDDVVVGSSSGHLWAFSGTTGVSLRAFPMRVGGRVATPPLVVITLDSDVLVVRPTVTLVVPAMDGYLYFVRAATGCTEKFDIGESVTAPPVSTDALGGSRAALVFAGLTGYAHVVETLAAVHLADGVYFDRSTTSFWGTHMRIGISIVDSRPDANVRGRRMYAVRISRGGSLALAERVLTEPGDHVLDLPMPFFRRADLALVAEMIDDSGAVSEDRMAVSVHLGVERIAKWLILVPFAVLTASLWF